jgi:hypothetical protein
MGCTHLKAIYQEGELDPQATCEEFLQVQIETNPTQCKMVKQVRYLIYGYLKDLNTHICFVQDAAVKDFFITDAIFQKTRLGART